MATLAIGDVHGNLLALDDLLKKVSPEVGTGDTVVFLGDYIDRGPDSKGCIEGIIEFQQTSKAQVIALLGNHEQWLLLTSRDYTQHSWILGTEAFPTIRSYSATAAETIREQAEQLGMRLVLEDVELPYNLFFEAVPHSHVEFLQGLRSFYRTPDAVCVHGGLHPAGAPVEEQQYFHIIYGADDFPAAYRGRDTVLYGHANDSLLDEAGWPHPRIVGRTFGLDSISHGVLTAIRLPDGSIYQSARFL